MVESRCQVYFVGAGPGDPELITVKGQKCIQHADLVLYTGSLVPKEVVAGAKNNAKIVDSSPLTLDETHSMILETVRSGGIAARVHTGDPSFYGALKEQMVLLERDGISYKIIPGVTAAFAAAAAAGISFTLPEKTQTLILTRLEGRTPVPDRERLRDLARHRSSLAIHLSASDPERIARELLAGGYPEDTPIILAYRVGWPDELIRSTTLTHLSKTVKEMDVGRQIVFLVLPGQKDEPIFSKLYSPEFTHGFRNGEK